MASRDDSFQLGVNNDPQNADPGKKRYTQNGSTMVQTDEDGNQILFGGQNKRTVIDGDAVPLESDNRNRVRLQTDDATHDFTIQLNATLELTDDWETTIQQTGLNVLHLKSVAGVTINGIDTADISLVGGIGQGIMTVEKIGTDAYLAFGSQ